MAIRDPEALRREVERYPWYHTMDLGGGVVTRGMFDHRPVLERYGLPASLEGRRCLDVGTYDGFWAFEMERRGAAEVVALDIENPDALDWPAAVRDRTVKTMDETKPERFSVAREALGSNVRRELRSVYDLGPDLGAFDVVFCGDLLLHLKDPITALERIRSVCTGTAIVVNPIRRFWFAPRRPLAQLDGIEEFRWWETNLAGLVRLVRAAGFPAVRALRPFAVPLARGGSWRGLRGVVHGFAAAGDAAR